MAAPVVGVAAPGLWASPGIPGICGSPGQIGDKTGEEMPDWIADKKRRAERIREAKAELEAEAKAAAEAKLKAEAEAAEKREAEGRRKPRPLSMERRRLSWRTT